MNDSSSSVDKTRIALITIAALLALGIGAVIYFITANNSNHPQSHIVTNGTAKTTSLVESTTPSNTILDNKESSNRFYKSQENLDDNEFERQLQVKTYDLDKKCVVLVKNNSEANLYIATTVKFFNRFGNQISVDMSFDNCVASGEEMAYLLKCEEVFSHAEYELQVFESEYEPAPIDKDIVYNSDEALVIAENNGVIDAGEPSVVALFFKDDILIDAVKETAWIGALEVGETTKIVVPIEQQNKNTTIKYYLHADPFILFPE